MTFFLGFSSIICYLYEVKQKFYENMQNLFNYIKNKAEFLGKVAFSQYNLHLNKRVDPPPPLNPNGGGGGKVKRWRRGRLSRKSIFTPLS